ncbi:sulfurtransferase [Aliidongia dinghuensis]|uniref:Sulfurtransferase n=1 Tax=Aliidongia dinghuensis TaxID=1867774 RepID=A0A8J3E2F1_9PROT|nr:chromate resistance protein ChrB domain-containing protein [Aliidongia dinghuensis]GGF09734.1 sulfurtransferase [Aliidongia dinghuensis]
MDVSVCPEDLQQSRGAFPPPLVIDVRPNEAFAAWHQMLPGAIRRDPDELPEWVGAIEIGRPIVVYGVQGREVSQVAATALRERGFVAQFLKEGIQGWLDRGFPLRPVEDPSLWVTRERPKVDRIACPWLIRRFIDPDARFLYVPADAVLAAAAATGATPYDIPGVELGHHGDECSFDAIRHRYRLEAPELDAPGLDRLATIVRGADTGRPDLVPEAAGLLAVSRGLSAVFDDDHRQLRHGLVVYDALYAACRAGSLS